MDLDLPPKKSFGATRSFEKHDSKEIWDYGYNKIEKSTHSTDYTNKTATRLSSKPNAPYRSSQTNYPPTTPYHNWFTSSPVSPTVGTLRKGPPGKVVHETRGLYLSTNYNDDYNVRGFEFLPKLKLNTQNSLSDKITKGSLISEAQPRPRLLVKTTPVTGDRYEVETVRKIWLGKEGCIADASQLTSYNAKNRVPKKEGKSHLDLLRTDIEKRLERFQIHSIPELEDRFLLTTTGATYLSFSNSRKSLNNHSSLQTPSV